MKKQHKHLRKHKNDNKNTEIDDLYPGHGTNIYDVAPAEEELCDCDNDTITSYYDNGFETLKK